MCNAEMMMIMIMIIIIIKIIMIVIMMMILLLLLLLLLISAISNVVKRMQALTDSNPYLVNPTLCMYIIMLDFHCFGFRLQLSYVNH